MEVFIFLRTLSYIFFDTLKLVALEFCFGTKPTVARHSDVFSLSFGLRLCYQSPYDYCWIDFFSCPIVFTHSKNIKVGNSVYMLVKLFPDLLICQKFLKVKIVLMWCILQLWVNPTHGPQLNLLKGCVIISFWVTTHLFIWVYLCYCFVQIIFTFDFLTYYPTT